MDRWNKFSLNLMHSEWKNICRNISKCQARNFICRTTWKEGFKLTFLWPRVIGSSNIFLNVISKGFTSLLLMQQCVYWYYFVYLVIVHLAPLASRQQHLPHRNIGCNDIQHYFCHIMSLFKPQTAKLRLQFPASSSFQWVWWHLTILDEQVLIKIVLR